MVLTKEEIRQRIRTNCVWVTGIRTPLFAAVPERQWRYVVAMFISGNLQQTTAISFEKLEEDATYTMEFSPIPVAPADFRQIPEGQYDLEDVLGSYEGGTRLYGVTDHTGMSLNVTVKYWDWDI